MIDINELRVMAEAAREPLILRAAILIELLDRLEAAESECLEEARLNGMGSEREAVLMAKLEAAEKDVTLKELVIDALGSELNAVAKERDELRAKIEAMEKQEPVGTLYDDGCFVWRNGRPYESNYAGWKMKLYALPGAKGE